MNALFTYPARVEVGGLGRVIVRVCNHPSANHVPTQVQEDQMHRDKKTESPESPNETPFADETPVTRLNRLSGIHQVVKEAPSKAESARTELERAFVQHRAKLRACAARLVGWRDADDLLQSAMLVAVSKYEGLIFAEDGAALAYLREVLCRAGLAACRTTRRLRLARTEEEHDEMGNDIIAEDVRPDEWHEAQGIEEAFVKASPRDRATIIEYQARSGEVPATKKERVDVCRARGRVRSLFQQLGIDVPPANDNWKKQRRGQ